jgi:putative oxidoreductase
VHSMPTSRSADPPRRFNTSIERLRALVNVADRAAFPLLRASLGVVFIWFGALKFSAATPVGDLVANTLPFLPKALVVPALGGFEVLLGAGLLVGRYLGAVALLMMAHLTGTFLVLLVEPDVAFQNGNPFLLTMTGEFVVKNLVLITAGLVLATWSRTRQAVGIEAKGAPLLADPGHPPDPLLVESLIVEPGLADAGITE